MPHSTRPLSALQPADQGIRPFGRKLWYVANTLPLSEPKACLHLQRQGWETFYPRFAKTIRSGRRVRTELRPLFPGYVFVSLDVSRDAWRSVDGTYGVRHLVRLGDVPSPLPGGVVESLREMTNAKGQFDFSRHLAIGSKVRFLSGPFAEMIGSLEHLDSQGRVRVLLDLFGRGTEVKARAVDLAPVA